MPKRTAKRNVRNASAIEIGPDEEILAQGQLQGETAFSKLLAHMKPYTPEWAAGICDVPAATIRRIAGEYLDHAHIGETIVIDGKTLPFRPVAVALGKTVNNGWGGFECCWARTMLAALVGALEVPGGTLGTTVRLNKPLSERHASVKPGAGRLHGLSAQPDRQGTLEGRARTSATPTARWCRSRPTGPGARRSGPRISPGCSSARRRRDCRASPTRSCGSSTAPIRRSRSGTPARSPTAWRSFPFVVALAYTRDETNHFADILLPDQVDLESLQLIYIGGSKYIEQFWKHEGYALRQPAVKPHGGRARLHRHRHRTRGAGPGCWSATTLPSTAAPQGLP